MRDDDYHQAVPDEFDLDDYDRVVATAAAELVDYCAGNVDDVGDFVVDVDHLVELAAVLVIAAVRGDLDTAAASGAPDHRATHQPTGDGAAGDAVTGTGCNTVA